MEDKKYLHMQQAVQAEEPDMQEEPEKKKRSLLRELFSLVEIFVVAFLLAQLMTRFVLINAEVPSVKKKKECCYSVTFRIASGITLSIKAKSLPYTGIYNGLGSRLGCGFRVLHYS